MAQICELAETDTVPRMSAPKRTLECALSFAPLRDSHEADQPRSHADFARAGAPRPLVRRTVRGPDYPAAERIANQERQRIERSETIQWGDVLTGRLVGDEKQPKA